MHASILQLLDNPLVFIKASKLEGGRCILEGMERSIVLKHKPANEKGACVPWFILI
jgi:hypothetical protein